MRRLRWYPLVALLGGCIIIDNSNRCFDGIRNGSESDVDCGGTCGTCVTGRRCSFSSDCNSAICTSGVCTDAQARTGSPRQTIPDPKATTTYRILPGAAIAGVKPGTDVGYFVTANVNGSYRLTWTGDADQSGKRRNFYGSIWTPGRFLMFTPGCAQNTCPLEVDDYVSQPAAVAGGTRIDFNTTASTGLDGFDFVVDVEPALFDIYIAGAQYKELVFFPATDSQPRGTLSNVGVIPFGLTTQ